MGFFDTLFGKKPEKKDIRAYNYYLYFDYLPKKLYDLGNNKGSFDALISFDSLVNKNAVWKSLIKMTSITSSNVDEFPDITLYFIKAPSNELMGEVALAIFAFNRHINKYIYYTMEYSRGSYMICSADEKGNHYCMESCSDGEQFSAYVLNHAMEELNKPVLTPKPLPESTPKQELKKGDCKSETKKAYDSLLERLDRFAENYLKKRGAVIIEDYIVARLEGSQIVLHISQNPELDFDPDPFDDPDCQVQLMFEFMDYRNRIKMADYFFRPYDDHDRMKEIKNNLKHSDIKDKYYSLNQLKQVQMGAVSLHPLDAGIVFSEDQQNVVINLAKRSPRIRKYLPNLDLSTNDAVIKYFSLMCQKTEMGLEFGYSIKLNRIGEKGFMGFIFVHTPTLNQASINFPHWTLDFCLFGRLEGKGFMRGCLITVLSILKKEMNVDYVYCIIDEHNYRCLRLMEKLPFMDTGQVLNYPDGKKANLYCCILKNLSFNKPIEFKKS